MPADQRAQLRAVIKRVHPDLFAADPDARATNAESLKVGNATSTLRLPCQFQALPMPGLTGLVGSLLQCS